MGKVPAAFELEEMAYISFSLCNKFHNQGFASTLEALAKLIDYENESKRGMGICQDLWGGIVPSPDTLITGGPDGST
jgi:hypothetical protein